MPDTWCVYRPEWVEAARTRGQVNRDDLAVLFRTDWEGKVGPDEWRLVNSGKAESLTWTLEVLLPTLKGEFKDRKLAEGYAAELDGAVVVLWGSEEEEALLGYGTRQLKTA